MIFYLKMEEIKQKAQKRANKDILTIISRAIKGVGKKHFQTKDGGIICGCDYCKAMINFVNFKINYKRRSNHLNATGQFFELQHHRVIGGKLLSDLRSRAKELL